MNPVDKLRSDRAYVLDAMHAIRSAADAETRSTLTEDEKARFDAGEKFVRECDEAIESHNTLARLAQDPAHVERSFSAPNVVVHDNPYSLDGIGFGDDQAIRSQALRALDAEKSLRPSSRTRPSASSGPSVRRSPPAWR